MAKSSRRRKHDRSKAEAKRAEQARRRARAERVRQQSERDRRLFEAASAAHAVGDEEGEHRYTAELLARADAEDDQVLRIDVARSIAANEHLGEALAVIEPYLRDHPDDEYAGEIYGVQLEQVQEDAAPGETERAALDRFGDRSGLTELREAIGAYLDETKWGDIVRKRVEENLAKVADLDWSPADREEFAALAFEAAVNGAADSEGRKSVGELIERDKREGPPPTTLKAFAADPSVPSALASRASVWVRQSQCGVWQLADPVPKPGVWCTELVSGTVRYVGFPAAALDGVPPWTVWLGSMGPVDGIWRSTGNGVRLSPAEGDAVAEYVDDAVTVMGRVLKGVPRDQIPELKPVPFGKAKPYGVRWEFEEPQGDEYWRFNSMVAAAIIMQLAVDVAKYRALPSTADDPVLIDATKWLDEPLPALDGQTPREAAAADVPDVGGLESLLRQLEYQAGLATAQGKEGTDIAWLRAELGLPAY